jgi:hypothetical protein
MSSRAKTLLFFLTITGALLAIQVAPTGFLDPDGYYHVELARLLARGHLLDSFPWLSATTWAKSFADQHFLYHALLIPFIKISPIVGAQVFNVLAGVGFAASFFFLLQANKISYPKLWTLLALFGAPDFLMRLSLVKAIPLSLLLLFLFLRVLLGNRPKWLAAIALVFVWTYGGFVFLPVILCCYLAVRVVGKWQRKNIAAGALTKIDTAYWRPILYALLGIVAGLLLFPHPANLLWQLYNQIFQAGLGAKIPVGNEWNPTKPLGLIGGYSFVLFVWLLACAVAVKNIRRLLKDWRLLFLLLLSLFFLGLSLKSHRFIEYGAPFMALFAAFALEPFLAKAKEHLCQAWQRCSLAFSIVSFPFFAGIGCVVLTITFTTLAVAAQTHNPIPIARYQGVSQYLLAHSRPGEIVFNVRWDDFPMLLFFNDHNYYIGGEDPMFMYLANQNKYWLWRHVFDDKLITCPAPACSGKNSRPLEKMLKDDFHTQYLLLENQSFPRLNANLRKNPRFAKVYFDPDISLFQLLPQ